MKQPIFTILFALCLVLSIPLSAAIAQNEVAESVTLNQIEVERKVVASSLSLTDQQRLDIQTKLDEAASLLQQTEQSKVMLQKIQAEIKLAPDKIKKLQKQPIAISDLSEKEISAYSTDRLKILLDELRTKLESSRIAKDEQEKLLASYFTLSKNGGAEIADINNRLDKLRSSATEVIVAERLYKAARIKMLTARHLLLKIKIDNLGLITELSTVQRDQFATQIKQLQKNMDKLHLQLQAKAGNDLKTVSKVSDTTSVDIPPEIKALQEKTNVLLTEQNRLLTESSIKSQRLDTVKRQLDENKADQERIRQIIEIAGNNHQVSTLLQNRRSLIPSVSQLTEEAISLQTEMSFTVLQQLTLDETLRKIGTGSHYIEQLLSATDTNDNLNPERAVNGLSKKSIDEYRVTIRELNKNYSAYIALLSSLEATTRQLLEISASYREFIDEHLLWMPSTSSIPLFHPLHLLNGLSWLVRPENLQQLLKDTGQILQYNKLKVVSLFVIVTILLFFRRKVTSAIDLSAIQTRKIRSDNITATLITLLSTLVLTLPAPVLLFGGGYLLGNTVNAEEYSLAIAAGLQGSGMMLLMLLFVKYLCQKNGLCIIHLRWQNELCEDLRKQSTWLISVMVPLSFVFSISAASVSSKFIYLSNYVTFNEPEILALGQLTFIAVLILLSLSVYKIWHNNGAVMNRLKEADIPGRWKQYYTLWFFPLIIIFPAFALVTLAGYYYTATFLVAKIILSFALILGLVLFKDILVRSLYVIQRRLKFTEALRNREEIRKQRESQSLPTDTAEVESTVFDEEKVAYGVMSDQVKQLIKTGFFIGFAFILWWVWKDTIPALNILNTVELPISTTTVIDGESRQVPLTLSDLLIGLLLGGLTLLAARSVPGLMEFTVLQHLPIGLASRYAVTTLTQYFVVMLGIAISFNALGLQWSNIQWLVAALSVGLGFGLQEIVANFVSGIILLFEQPIRVGDVVTVDGTSGTVTRIRIRATTILNWEKQELIVPNKSFITGQLVNWTLSDKLNRILISVGVAYGTDTVKAMQLMREAADEHPKVLSDPEPRVTFEEFGDNSLNLKLRAYLNEIDDRLPTITELNQAINDKFNEAGIVIAFPQRDLHLDSAQPLEFVLKEDTRR